MCGLWQVGGPWESPLPPAYPVSENLLRPSLLGSSRAREGRRQRKAPDLWQLTSLQETPRGRERADQSFQKAMGAVEGAMLADREGRGSGLQGDLSWRATRKDPL